ncbi:DUF4129 domain-containing protein [Skermania sp. ID1734]|uniref:DUF4129 domain-containing protein n=1 Tax=Skermania sp. ID1734 TaxID=2597516 RepID=UPI00117F8BB4|nr:DUF4129 domain-containing protein [Skermania sp. ID1734]TSD95645.1 DUF4129 domain-containing protein [Skermania sp. ID1734]
MPTALGGDELLRMAGSDKEMARVVGAAALIVLAVITLRGYLPGVEPQPRSRPTGGPMTFVAVIVMLGGAIVITAIGLIAMLRQRVAVRPDLDELPDPFRRPRKPPLRLLLYALGAVLLGLVVVVILARLGIHQPTQQHPPGKLQPAPGSGRATPAPPPQQPPPDQGTNTFPYIAAMAIALMLLFAAGAFVVYRRRVRTPEPYIVADFDMETPEQPPDSAPLVRAAELGLAEIGDLSREPREAIIACYAAMEDALANAPEAAPQDSDTPSEVLARAVEHHAVHAENAANLVQLFAEARFSPHVMTENHRDAAVRSLRSVLAELRSVA